MPIYKNKKNDTWYIKVYVKNENGVSKQITKRSKEWTGRNGKLLAQQEEIRLKNKLETVLLKDSKITIYELCNAYLNYIKDNVRESTYERSNNIIRTHILPYLGKRVVNSITSVEIIEWHKKIDAYISSKNKKLSSVYKQKIHSTLSTIFNYGCKYHNINQNVPKIVGNFKTPRGTNKKEMTIMTLNEFNQFIEFEGNNNYKDFFIILFYTGMRRGELLALKWEDIDFVNNTIKISKTISIRKNSKIQMPKTNKSNRTIKMLSIVRNVLQNKMHESDFVFYPESIKGTTLDRKCKSNCKKINFDKNMRIHDFRHSFASMCINKDVPIAIISEYLGHENISTTLDIYSHLYPDSQNKLINILENV